ncbi:MAG: cache domain-containing protein [Pseudomonadota bacterium]
MLSVRYRLLILALAPMVVLMPLLLFLSMTRWTADYDEVLIDKVDSDLRIAEQYLAQLLDRTRADLAAVAASTAFSERGNDADFFSEKRAEQALDYLYFMPRREAAQSSWPVIVAAARGQGGTVLDIMDQATLRGLAPTLASRARIPLIPTEAAVPTTRTIEDRGMVIHAAVPAPGGVLVGGVLLNGNLGFIDTINALVFDEGATGTATLFLEDVRVSTNVRLFEDVRAVGTRVSAEVRRAVLDEGRTWLNRAFVVNDWYISGYLPLQDSFGENIGMLYVGFLEAPFTVAKRNGFLTVLGAFIFVLLVSAPLFLRMAKGIFAPLERMTHIMLLVRRGNLSARNGDMSGSGEIGEVARHLDDLLNQVQERDEDLNERVEQRTAELRESNAKLEETFRQLVMSEKLASIGEITAGVAHEIGNPVAVIQGNVDVIRDSLDVGQTDVGTELSLIDRQVGRIQTIVSKLLRFARPGEFADLEQTISVSPVVRDCLELVDHLITRANIEVETQLEATVHVRIDPGELQQVMVNLIMNGVQAMEGAGSLTVSTRDAKQDGALGVLITVADTGPGIAPDRLNEVFDPFFTTKQSEGTGLGLSISQTLIQRANGIITATNRRRGGARFEIWLPASKVPEQVG